MLYRYGSNKLMGAGMDATLKPSRGSDRALNWFLWLALFWVFSYAVLTLRAQVEFGAAFEWLHEKRAVGVTVGALLFGAVLLVVQHVRDARARALLLLASVLPASLIVFAARSAFDVYVLGSTVVNEEINWTIVWAGYFGLALGAYLAVQHRSAVTRRSAIAEAIVPTTADYIWVVDALADELGDRPDGERLLADLRRRAGYLMADESDPAAVRHNARVRLVERLAERIEG